MVEHPDLALLKEAAAGNRGAFSQIVQAHADRIRRVSYLLLHSSPAAEDTTQEIFAQALVQLKKFRGDGEPGSWLLSIALNLCRRAIRDEKRHASPAETNVLEGGRRVHFSPRGILTSLVRRETARSLAIALGYLTEPQREAFVLHYVEELPYEDIAAILGTSVVAARGLAFRARQILQTKLRSADVDTTVLGIRRDCLGR